MSQFLSSGIDLRFEKLPQNYNDLGYHIIGVGIVRIIDKAVCALCLRGQK